MSQEKGPGEYATIVYVNSRYVSGGRETPVNEGQEIAAISKFETTPATVHRGYGLTLNQGNYESARVDVSITLPCYVEDVEAADEYARQFVEKRIQQEVASVRGAQEASKKPQRTGGGGTSGGW